MTPDSVRIHKVNTIGMAQQKKVEDFLHKKVVYRLIKQKRRKSLIFSLSLVWHKLSKFPIIFRCIIFLFYILLVILVSAIATTLILSIIVTLMVGIQTFFKYLFGIWNSSTGSYRDFSISLVAGTVSSIIVLSEKSIINCAIDMVKKWRILRFGDKINTILYILLIIIIFIVAFITVQYIYNSIV